MKNTVTSARNKLLILTLAFVFGEAALSKLFGGGTPDWFLKQFSGSLLDLGGSSLALSYWMIALFEAVSAILLVSALVKPAILKLALLASQVTFFALMIGQRLTHQYDQSFQLFAYGALTFLAASVLTSESRPQ